MNRSHFAFAACFVSVAACAEIRLEDDAGSGGAGAGPGTTITTTSSKNTSVTSVTSGTSSTGVTTGGGVTVEVLPTGTSAHLLAAAWRGDAIVVAGEAATALELHPGDAPTALDGGLVEHPLLRFTSLTSLGGTVYAGAIDGQGDRAFAHVLRFDTAWEPAWIPATSCLRDPALVTFRESEVVAVCGYYPWLGRIDGTGLSLDVPDGFDHVAYLSWPKWDELLASDGTGVYRLDAPSLARIGDWTLPPDTVITNLLQDHVGRRIGVDDAGDVLSFAEGVEVVHAGDGVALRAGAMVGVDATLFVGDAGEIRILRDDAGPLERIESGVTTALRAVAIRDRRAVVVGDDGVALLVTVD